MKTSESIAKIAEALSLAQGEMTGAKKGAANPYFKSKYADLSEVIETISAPFAKHGLSYIQSASFVDGKISVVTRIMHKSGEWLESDPCELPPVKNDPQAYGSAITYAKRYSLQAFCGVPSVDDDGNEAVKQTTKPKPVKLDSKIVDSINGCESIEQLAEVWKGLTPAQHKVYAGVKDNRKVELTNDRAA